MIGISSIATLVAWNPSTYDLAAQRSLEQARLRDGLSAVVDRYGLYWLQQSTPDKICTFLSTISNSTVSISATIDGTRCRAYFGPHEIEANLTVRIVSRVLDLESWYTGRV